MTPILRLPAPQPPCFSRVPAVDQFNLVQPVDRLCQRVVITVATTSHRRFNPCLGKSLGIANENILRSSVRTMDQGIGAFRLTGVLISKINATLHCYLQLIEPSNIHHPNHLRQLDPAYNCKRRRLGYFLRLDRNSKLYQIA